MPGLVKFRKQNPKFPLFLLNVVNGTKETTTSGFQYLKDNKFDLPNYWVSEQDAMAKYGLEQFSLLLAYDKDGKLVKSLTSFNESELLALAKEMQK